jgi:hypothetical protein
MRRADESRPDNCHIDFSIVNHLISQNARRSAVPQQMQALGDFCAGAISLNFRKCEGRTEAVDLQTGRRYAGFHTAHDSE